MPVPTISEIAATPVNSIPDVIAVLETIDAQLPNTDGLKWFNWLYLTVTSAMNTAVSSMTWQDAAWLSALDVVFARLYLEALASSQPAKCWQTLFLSRGDSRLARIQFAMAGMNAHISHDLPYAVVQTCEQFNIAPELLSKEYRDYTQVNEVLDPLIDRAKAELKAGLLGDDLPCIHLVELLMGSFCIGAVREVAWVNAQILWRVRQSSLLENGILSVLDETTALGSRGLLAPVGI